GGDGALREWRDRAQGDRVLLADDRLHELLPKTRVDLGRRGRGNALPHLSGSTPSSPFTGRWPGGRGGRRRRGWPAGRRRVGNLVQPLGRVQQITLRGRSRDK